MSSDNQHEFEDESPHTPNDWEQFQDEDGEPISVAEPWLKKK